MMEITQIKLGQRLEADEFFKIDQKQIQAFADVTGDQQWIHVDQARCAQESPFKSTIAHGFLSLSLMPKMFAQCVAIDASSMTLINYGMDNLRFLEPVRVNDKIKYSFVLCSKENKSKGELYKFECKLLIENRESPALVGTFLTMLIA